MNKKKFLPIVIAGGILLTLFGALWAIRALPSQTAQPPPPITDLLLRDSDLSRCGFEWEQDERDRKEIAREMAEFVGLSPDYLEGDSVYFLVFSPPEPKAKDDNHLGFFAVVVHGLYRYESEKAAIARYGHLIEALPLAPLGRETPIISRAEWSFKGVKGQVIETQDPIGTAYWFIGVRGDLLTIMVVLSTGTNGQPVFEQLLPIVLSRMASL